MKETKSYTVKKMTGVEQYTIRRSGWCASVYLNNETGEVTVVQSNGQNYDYCWSSPGRGDCTLKEFLIRTETSYVMNKFSYGHMKWFNQEATVKRMREDVEKAFKEERIDELDRDMALEEIEENLDGDDMPGGVFAERMLSSCNTLFEDVYGSDYLAIPTVEDYHPQLRGFMEKIWPAFVESLKQEIENEKRA